MLKEEINKYNDVNGFIFDGFPRTKYQAQEAELREIWSNP